jgi:parallel beta-helix repeat protein
LKLQCKIFLLLFTFFLLNCTKNPTEPETFTITGIVTLEGETNHSGVIVALYQLVELDTAITSLRKRFPTVGFPLSQATEFDHRLAQPLLRTNSDKDGQFTLSNVSEGTYNLLVEKYGYGWRYVYDVQSGDIVEKPLKLYPEMRVQGTLAGYTVWPADHHIIIAGNVTVPPGETLIVDKGAVIRFNGFYQIKVYGNIQVNGKMEEMVQFTVNNVNSNLLWRGIFLKDLNASANINWAIMEFSDIGISANGSSLSLNSAYLRKINFEGILLSANVDCEISNNVITQLSKGIKLQNVKKGKISNNFIHSNNENGVIRGGIILEASTIDIIENIFYLLEVGVQTEGGNVKFIKNLVSNCDRGFVLTTPYYLNNSSFLINNNTITDCERWAINIWRAYPDIQKNNLIQTTNYPLIYTYGTWPELKNIIATNNYWVKTRQEDILRLIQDDRTDLTNKKGNWQVQFEPFSTIYISDALP